MTPFEVGLLGFALMLTLMFVGLPIGVSMGLVGFLGIWYLKGMDIGVNLVGLLAYTSVTHYTISAMPLFLLMGVFAAQSGISSDIYNTAQKWVGHLPGGLAIATVLGAGGFAAICGHSGATAAALGTVSYPQMRKHGYPRTLAGGCIAAGGTIGSMIPPSIMMVIIGMLTEQSVGKLLVAGFLPGTLQIVTYALMIYGLAKFRRGWVPLTASTPWKARLDSLKSIWSVLVIFLVVIGGIYAGIMTPTEGASVGAFCTFVLLAVRKGLNWQSLKKVLVETTTIGAMLLMILVGAFMFNSFLAFTRLPMELTRQLAALALPPYGVLGMVILMYLILGCVMDTLAMLLLTLPLVFPIMTGLGFNPIWFCVFTLRLMEIALITPPVGMNIFVLKGVIPDASAGELFKGIVPFVMMDIVNLGILIAFPIIITLIPSLM